MEKIPCTVGILAYNSIGVVPRALESVKDFAEIIVADGGSTDETVAFAARFGARVIEQSRRHMPIEDFALERNRLLTAATQKWFFYLDADEVMSEALREDIRRVASRGDGPKAYRVRYLKTNADATKEYRTYREYYQVRLTRTDIGAQFIKPVHERLKVPEGAIVGQLEGPWYVPLESDDLSFGVFFPKAWRRTGATLAHWKPKGALDTLRTVFFEPATLASKSLFKMVATPLKWGRAAIPFKYELLRFLYACMLSIQALHRLSRFHLDK